jgi:hypothetical protein
VQWSEKGWLLAQRTRDFNERRGDGEPQTTDCVRG